MIEKSISGLYYSYKRVDDKEIKDILKNVILIRKAEIGNSGKFEYYPLTEESMKKIMKNPRGTSLSFDASTTTAEPVKGLEVYKEFTYLVKSSSRFFLKPDIGEIIDQIPFDDRLCPEFHAICINDEYELLPDTDGEHFIMTATLMINKEIVNREKQDAINELHKL